MMEILFPSILLILVKVYQHQAQSSSFCYALYFRSKVGLVEYETFGKIIHNIADGLFGALLFFKQLGQALCLVLAAAAVPPLCMFPCHEPRKTNERGGRDLTANGRACARNIHRMKHLDPMA